MARETTSCRPLRARPGQAAGCPLRMGKETLGDWNRLRHLTLQSGRRRSRVIQVSRRWLGAPGLSPIPAPRPEDRMA